MLYLDESMKQKCDILRSCLNKKQEEFEKIYKPLASSSDILQETKVSLYSICNDDSLSVFLDIMVDLVYYCEAGVIVTSPKLYDVNRKILFSEFKELLSGSLDAYRNGIFLNDADAVIQYSVYTLIDEDKYFEDFTADDLSNTLDYLVKLFTLPANQDSEIKSKVLSDIRECVSASSPLECAYGAMGRLDGIMECLKALYESTFSLYPYFGVITFFGERKYNVKVKKKEESGVVESTVVRTRSEDAILRHSVNSQQFTPVLPFEYMNTYTALANSISSISARDYERGSEFISTDRCYNLQAILDSDNGLYYPYEAFGLATGSTLLDYYEPDVSNIWYVNAGYTNWANYSQYVKEHISKLLTEYIYMSLEKHCKTPEGDNLVFEGVEFASAYTSGRSKYDIYNEYCNPLKYKSAVLHDVDKFVRSICRAVVITRNDFNELHKIRLVDFDNSFGINATSKVFCSDIFTNNSADVRYEPGVCISLNGLKAKVYEYSFCLDVSLLDKKPLFGYTAARLFQRNGQKIDRNNILLGETVDGTPLFSSSKGFNLRTQICHRFSAGSRSGKGVITMNVLASGVASDVAVFYIDRKPDMASELAYITNGNMFVVNGGDTASNDVHKMFYDPSSGKYGKMLSWFKPGSSEYKRRYLTAVFGEKFGDTYAGAFGDLIYQRAFMLALSIVGARIHFTKYANAEAAQDLGLGGGVMVVIDEVTNWHYNFESRYFETHASGMHANASALLHYYDSSIGASSISESEFASISDLLDDSQRILLDSCRNTIEANKEAARMGDATAIKAVKSATTTLNSLMGKLKKASGKEVKNVEESLYWTTYMDKYQSIIAEPANCLNVAGVIESMYADNDVYMIGQYLTGFPNTGAPVEFTNDHYFKKAGTADSGLRKSFDGDPTAPEIVAETFTRSYLFGFAEAMHCDWFIGRNVEDKNNPLSQRMSNFGGTHMKEINPALDSWLHTRGNWAYLPSGTQEVYRGGRVDNVPSSAIMLKPYLVLNTNDEPSEGVRIDEGSVQHMAGTTPYDKPTKMHYDNTKYSYVLNCADRVKFKDWEAIRLQHVPEHYNASSSNPCYGHLEEGIGLRGLITEYKRTDPNYRNYEFNEDCMVKSKMIADAVVRRFGYKDYIEYLYDLSPRGLIGLDDIIAVYENPVLVHDQEARLRFQLPRYYNSGNGALVNGGTVEDDIPYSSIQTLVPENVVSNPESIQDVDIANTVLHDNATLQSEQGDDIWASMYDVDEDFTDDLEIMSDEELYAQCSDIVDIAVSAYGKPISQQTRERAIQIAITHLRKAGY